MQICSLSIYPLDLLQFNGKDISWRHIANLYMQDRRPGVGLTLLPKLKLEHIRLNSFSKMRVDLATQVMVGVMYTILAAGLSCSYMHALWPLSIITMPQFYSGA